MDAACVRKKGLQHQSGGATFLTAVILLVVTTMIAIFAANITRNIDKEVGNQARARQAFAAAEAGMEFGISYLKQNYSTIIASPSSGHINFSNASITNVSQADGSKYSVVYTNPIANNYTLIAVTSTGTSADNSATRTAQQQIQSDSIIGNFGNSSIVSKGQIDVGGNATIQNTVSNQTILSGGDVSFSGSGHTVTSGGTMSNASGTGADVTQNSTTLSNMSNSDFFANYFGTTNTDTVKSQVVNYYNNSSNTNYSATLNGKTGTSIWIDQTSGTTATINGNTTIGSAANPVLLVVNGNLSISGNVTIYGFIYILGTSNVDTLTGNITINGGLATTGNFNMTGSSQLTYDPTVLTNLSNQNSLRYYAKAAGTWKDF